MLNTWGKLSLGDILMGIAVVIFILAGVAKFWERQKLLGLSLILIGVANAILLMIARR